MFPVWTAIIEFDGQSPTKMLYRVGCKSGDYTSGDVKVRLERAGTRYA